MVAIFTGLGAGFERGSTSALLGSSSLGRNNQGVFLNAANGNLLITGQDEFLVGLGPDNVIARTYNSSGALDDNGDNILAALPDVIGQTIGEAIAGAVTRRPVGHDEAAEHGNSGTANGARPGASVGINDYPNRLIAAGLDRVALGDIDWNAVQDNAPTTSMKGVEDYRIQQDYRYGHGLLPDLKTLAQQGIQQQVEGPRDLAKMKQDGATQDQLDQAAMDNFNMNGVEGAFELGTTIVEIESFFVPGEPRQPA